MKCRKEYAQGSLVNAMLVFILFTFLLSSSKGVPRHYDEDFADALLEHIQDLRSVEEDDYTDYAEDDEGEDVVQKLLEFLKKRKRNTSRFKDFEIYNFDDSENNDVLDYKDLISRELLRAKIHEKKQTHSKSVHQKIYKKEILHKKRHKKEYRTKLNSKKEKQSKLSKREFVAKFEDNNDDATPLESRNAVKKEDATKKNDNEQVATVSVNDDVEKQQEFVRKLNAKDVFMEAEADVNTTTKKPAPKSAHAKQTITTNKKSKDGLDRVSFIAVIAGCVVAGIGGIALATYCWFKLRHESKEVSETVEPVERKSSKKKEASDGKGKPAKASFDDDKLAQSAEVFHYLHAKKQMQQMGEPNKSEKYVNDETSDDEDDADENTVYECPGLAPPGDMKVVNPLFSDTESHHSDHHSDRSSQDGDSLKDFKSRTSPPR